MPVLTRASKRKAQAIPRAATRDDHAPDYWVIACGCWMMALSGPAVRAHEAATPNETRELGDGKISATPKRGFVFGCSGHFPGGGGAHRTGPWMGRGTWQPALKPHVEGHVVWSNARVTIAREGAMRVVRANALPTHATGEFPVKDGTQAYTYDRNPHALREHEVVVQLPADPVIAAQPSCVPMGLIGFAVSGAALFNAFDLAGRDAPAYEIQDDCNGHPEVTGRYHYHDWSPCLDRGRAGEPVGWMLDGFPILGPREEDGRAVTNAELDDCHGRVGPVMIDGRRVETYHYRFTTTFPYTIGCFKGVPVSMPGDHVRKSWWWPF